MHNNKKKFKNKYIYLKIFSIIIVNNINIKLFEKTLFK